MELFEALKKRHSYRGAFLPRSVPKKDLEDILDAGIRAPSGYNGQSTSFVAVDDPELLAKIAQILSGDAVKTAPAIICVFMDGRTRPGMEFMFGVEDYAASTENMLLAITALGYASVWIDGALRKEGRAKKLADLLGVPDTLELRVVLPLGAPAEKRPQKEKKPFSERAWFNRYEAPKS
jgi:nitroreductase